MLNVTISSVSSTKERNEAFSNVNYDRCPVCSRQLDKWKVVKGSRDEFKVCIHKKCIDKLTPHHCIEALSWDDRFADVSFDYQDETAEIICNQIKSIY